MLFWSYPVCVLELSSAYWRTLQSLLEDSQDPVPLSWRAISSGPLLELSQQWPCGLRSQDPVAPCVLEGDQDPDVDAVRRLMLEHLRLYSITQWSQVS